MSNIILVLFIIIILITGFYYLRNHRNLIYKKSLDNVKKTTDTFHLKTKRLTPTLDQSWQFIHDITDQVIKKFSKKDQDLLISLGKVLVEVGMIYNHVVEYGIRRINVDSKKQDKDKKLSSSK